VEKHPVATRSAKAQPASKTASPHGIAENARSPQPSEVDQKEAFLNLMLDSDIVGSFFSNNISGVMMMASIVEGGSFRILEAEKKGNVFYLHSQVVMPASGPRPKIYLDKEAICIGDNGDTVIIQTCA